MSFQDIESGSANARTAATPQSKEEAAFLGLQSSLSMQVFKINANVQAILKLVDQLGTGRDVGSLRKGLHDLTESTRDMAKRGTDDLKKLAQLQAGLAQYKTAVQKTSHDFQLSFANFQRAQQISAERQRTVVESVKIAVDEDRRPDNATAPDSSPEQRQAQILQAQLSPQELQYQESLIQERQRDIQEIESGIHELQEIFRDLGTLVTEQGDMIDNIETNISHVAVDTNAAAEELTVASDYQRRAGRRAACLGIVVIIVIAIVLLAVLS